MKNLFLLLTLILLSSCATVEKSGTLADIDISGGIHTQTNSRLNKKSEKQIRQAYTEYLKHAAKNDISRRDALQRLAQLEFNLTEKLEQTRGVQTKKTEDIEDKLYFATLDRSISLLKTSLRDYPHARNNDKTLYQLAKAYDQRDLYQKSIETLRILVKKYPKSQYYVESEFRLGEDAFSHRQYSKAEDLYTNVIVSPKNSEYLENALYKRGWSRYKQGFYQDAVDDFLHVINLHDFVSYAQLNKSEKNQFNEYFRAVGLSFSYLGGAQSLDSYFKQHSHFRFIYHTYAHVSDIYLKQQRYTDAADTLSNFIKYHPDSPQVPIASVRILDIWNDGGFDNKLIPALRTYYALYHPESHYWTHHDSSKVIYDKVTGSIRKYLVLAATHSHKRYMALHDEKSFDNAREWYLDYLKYFSDYSRKDNIHVLYAELLASHGNTAGALANYEKAAYDSGIILDKDAAYETILLSDKLFLHSPNAKDKTSYLNKLITYSLRFARLYPNDPKTLNVITHASQRAYQAEEFPEAVKLAELYQGKGYTTPTYSINLIKANAYFKLKRYQDAESAYKTVISHYTLNTRTARAISDNLALSIYDQGKQAQSEGNTDIALANYSRIYKVVPDATVAATGLYDAISLCITNKLWDKAIVFIKQFQASYPNSKLNQDVSKKLSIAYLNSHQDLAAANELVKIANSENDSAYKRAALWKAGQLYESRQDYTSAIHSYQTYAGLYHQPFPQYMEAMQKLTKLYENSGDIRSADKWRRSILKADKRTPTDKKTDRTRFIASDAALLLAQQQQSDFDSVKLTVPLQRNLKHKKTYMQQAVNLYGLASSYGISTIATKATYSIAEIYLSFSKALLNSERPRNLSKTELEQYNILIEDKSYPFEDKAIEFYATNLGHVRDGIFDKWMKKSYARLQKLYPERYNRDVKLESYINVLQ